MLDPSAPCLECGNDPGGVPTETVRSTVEPFENPDVDDWFAERVQAEECAFRWKSALDGCCLGTVRELTAGMAGCR